MPNPLLPTTFQPIGAISRSRRQGPKFAVSPGRDAAKYHMARMRNGRNTHARTAVLWKDVALVWCSFCLNNQVSQLLSVSGGAAELLSRDTVLCNRTGESMNSGLQKEFSIHLLMR